MKRIWGTVPARAIPAFLTSLLVASTSCANLLTVQVDTSASTTVEGSIAGGLLGLIPFDDLTHFDIADSEELENQGVAAEDIQSVVLTAFTLTVEAPEDGDMSFVSSLEFFAEAEGLERIRIAYSDEFPEGARTVSLQLEDVELVEYVVAESMEITTEASATVPSETTTLRADVSFDVTATVTGACHAIQGE